MAIEVKTASGAVTMKIERSEDGLLVWSLQADTALTAQEIQSVFPRAISIVPRGKAWLITGIQEPGFEKGVMEDIESGPIISDPMKAQRIHEIGYELVRLELSRSGYAQAGIDRDAGRQIVSEVLYGGRVLWATVAEDGHFLAQESLGQGAKKFGWMMIVPTDHWKSREMTSPYQFTTSSNDIPHVLIKSFNVTPEWAAVFDARFRTHLHDRAVHIEKSGLSPDSNKVLMGDVRGFEAVMATANILSKGRYYEELDRVINEYNISSQTIVPALKQMISSGAILSEGDELISPNKPPRSLEEEQARNAVHIVSLVLRILHRDPHADSISQGIAFMHTIRELGIKNIQDQ